MKQFYPLLLFVLLCSSCSKNVVVRPGSVDALDSKTYDVLLVAQSVLDNAKVSITSGKLPLSAKPIINQVGSAYNLLRDLWLEYRKDPNESTAKKVIDATDQINKYITTLRNIEEVK